MARLEYTKEESLRIILSDIETLVFLKKFEKEYKHSLIGLNLLETIEMTKNMLQKELRRHRCEFGECVKVNIFERMFKWKKELLTDSEVDEIVRKNYPNSENL